MVVVTVRELRGAISQPCRAHARWHGTRACGRPGVECRWFVSENARPIGLSGPLRDSSDTMKNITISIDDETYRKARIKAAERDTSVSALVKSFLAELAAGESDLERLKREERALRESITNFRAGDRLPREDVHDRRS